MQAKRYFWVVLLVFLSISLLAFEACSNRDGNDDDENDGHDDDSADDDDDVADDDDDDDDDDDSTPTHFGRPAPGIPAVTEIENLPILRYGSVAKQVSSHDKAGGNEDGFAGNTELYIDENGEYVVFDDYGPGCVYRIWFTATWAWINQIRIYVEDMDEPVVDSSFLTFFGSTVPPFELPLTYTIHQSSGGFATYAPFCYQDRAKITMRRAPEFYNITWRRYPADTTVPSFTGEEDYEKLSSQWAEPAVDPKPPLEVRAETGDIELDAGEKETILDEQGYGTVWNLYLDPRPFETRNVANLWVMATWDGHESPDVEVPMSEFFGSTMTQRAPQGLLLGHDGGRYYCRFPMPYWQSARIEIENRGTVAATVSFEIEIHEEQAYPTDAGYFTAIYRKESPTTLGADYLIADVEGAGHYVGITYTMEGPLHGSYMEGDERFYLDGSHTPAIYGTGTEDYFNGGWYFLFGAFDRPVHGAPARILPLSATVSRTEAYRMHIGDLLPFFTQARLGIEHDKDNGDTRDSHSSVAYFYLRPKPLTALSDTLDVGVAASEATQDYRALDATPVAPFDAYFEGDFDNVLRNQGGNDVETSSTFTLRIDPGNKGVLLRRWYDQSAGRQLAEVYVDGQYAGRWYDVFQNDVKKFAQSDFPLPPSLTAGKNEIVVSLENTGDAPWSEFLYEAFSYLSVE